MLKTTVCCLFFVVFALADKPAVANDSREFRSGVENPFAPLDQFRNINSIREMERHRMENQQSPVKKDDLEIKNDIEIKVDVKVEVP